MAEITSVHARQILDCKTRPLVEVEVRTASGHVGRGAAPTGSTVGMYEATVLRDGGSEYSGLSVHRAVSNVEDIIAPALIGRDVGDQAGLDRIMIELDGTERKTRLGGNAIYSTSIAVLRAAAAESDRQVFEHVARADLAQVPVPCFNMVNGGSTGAVVQPFNEFILVPHRAESVEHAIEMGVEVFAALARILEKFEGASPRLGGSYGYLAPTDDPGTVLHLMLEAADACGYADLVALALDCASSEMFDAQTETYLLDGRRVPADALIDHAVELTERFDLVFVEDLLDENDWAGFADARRRLERTIVLSDDLTVTNRAKIERAWREQAIGGFVLKPNQVGTISEAFDAFDYATTHALLAIPSGRSGGVIDDIVMDLSVGLQVPFQKNGAPRSGERIEKLNFLIRAAGSIPGCRLADLGPLLRF
jgi:enolase